MPERGGGEGGGGKHTPRQAVLLRGVVGLLHPTPGTNLEVKRHIFRGSFPSFDKQTKDHDNCVHKPPGGRS